MQKKGQRNGFTLIELILTLLILSIIASIGSQVLQASFRAYFTHQSITNANAQANLALERITRDIDAIKAKNTITTASNTQLSFTDVYNNSITYQLVGTQLMRNNQVLSDGVSVLAFDYLDQNAVSTNVLANICYVTVNFVILQNNIRYVIRTTVSPMNFT